MDKLLNSPFSQPTWHSPQIFSLRFGIWPALIVQRSTIAWNMARTHEKQSSCFLVYFSLKTQIWRGRAGLKMCSHKLVCIRCHNHDKDLYFTAWWLFVGEHGHVIYIALQKWRGVELSGYLRKQIQSQGKWREEQQEGCDLKGKPAQGPRPADQIRAADKEEEHLLECVLLKAIKSGQDQLCLRGICLKIGL